MGRKLDIIPKYARFFIRNANERYLVMRGSRRSGKSVAVYQWVTLLLMCERKECIVLTATYPASTAAIKDFTIATGLPVTGNAIYGNSHIFENGSVISFRAFDGPEKAQGTYCNIAIIEEALNVPEQVVSVFGMSVTDQLYFLYNPTKTAYTDKYIKPDKSNFLVTTFKDNPYLRPEQIQEFELIKERALSPTATILDRYNYSVYYKGEHTDMSGKVFMQVFECSDEEFERVPVSPSYAIDFGFLDSRDQTAMTAVKAYENTLYVKELIFSDHLSKDEDLYEELKRLGLCEYVTIVGDYGGLGRSRILNLRDMGVDIKNASKQKIIDDIQRILQFDKIVITNGSLNLRREMDGYELKPDGKPVGECHLLDSMRYAYNDFRSNYLF